MTTGADIRRMLALIREQEYPLPEVMETDGMEPLPARDRSKLVGLLQRLAYLRGLASLRRAGRVRQRLRSEKR